MPHELCPDHSLTLHSFSHVEAEFPAFVPTSQSRKQVLASVYAQMLRKVQESTKVWHITHVHVFVDP